MLLRCSHFNWKVNHSVPRYTNYCFDWFYEFSSTFLPTYVPNAEHFRKLSTLHFNRIYKLIRCVSCEPSIYDEEYSSIENISSAPSRMNNAEKNSIANVSISHYFYRLECVKRIKQFEASILPIASSRQMHFSFWCKLKQFNRLFIAHCEKINISCFVCSFTADRDIALLLPFVCGTHSVPPTIDLNFILFSLIAVNMANETCKGF